MMCVCGCDGCGCGCRYGCECGCDGCGCDEELDGANLSWHRLLNGNKIP